MFLRLLLICLLLLAPGTALAESFHDKVADLASVTSARVGRSEGKLRLVLDAGKAIDYSVLALSSPPRIVLNLNHAWLKPDVAREQVTGSRTVPRVRLAQFNPMTVRVVIETPAKKDAYKVYTLANPWRLVIDFDIAPGDEPTLPSSSATSPPPPSTATQPTPSAPSETKPSPSASPTPAPASKIEEDKPAEVTATITTKSTTSSTKPTVRPSVLPGKTTGKTGGKGAGKSTAEKLEDKGRVDDAKLSGKLKGKRIAIDPGHGGEDPGALGSDKKRHEADITLEVALELQRILKTAGAKVTMTRTTDTEVSPKHTKATDIEELQARCDIANRAGADAFVSIHMDSFVTAASDGTTGYYYKKAAASSRALANAVLKGVVGELKTTNRGCQTCDFYVVKHTEMPATLIELAFISNPNDRKRLANAKGVQSAALGIAKGLSDFFAGKK